MAGGGEHGSGIMTAAPLRAFVRRRSRLALAALGALCGLLLVVRYHFRLGVDRSWRLQAPLGALRPEAGPLPRLPRVPVYPLYTTMDIGVYAKAMANDERRLCMSTYYAIVGAIKQRAPGPTNVLIFGLGADSRLFWMVRPTKPARLLSRQPGQC